MRNLSCYLVIVGIMSVIFVGCAPHAPHDNPLDPESHTGKSDGTLSGKILILNSITRGISGALVTIEGTTLAELTAADGSFNFPDAPSGNVTVLVAKASFKTDTLKLNLFVGGNLDTVTHLDALPQVSGPQVATSDIDQWYPGPVYTAAISATVTDPDGFLDVDTVYATIDSLAFGMNHTTGDNYQVTINADSLPDQDLQWIIGKEFNVVAVDHENGVEISSGFYATRIIESEPNPTSPTEGLIITTHFPTFDWDRASVSFAATYQLQVVSLAGGTQTPIWSQSGFSPATESFNFPDSLASGNYYWTVAVVDQFGNSCRSREAAFTVPSP